MGFAHIVCSGPTPLSQAGDRFLDLAGGLFETCEGSDSRPPVSASARTCPGRFSMTRASSSHGWSLVAAPVVAIARRRRGQAAGTVGGLSTRGKADEVLLRNLLRAACTPMRARAMRRRMPDAHPKLQLKCYTVRCHGGDAKQECVCMPCLTCTSMQACELKSVARAFERAGRDLKPSLLIRRVMKTHCGSSPLRSCESSYHMTPPPPAPAETRHRNK